MPTSTLSTRNTMFFEQAPTAAAFLVEPQLLIAWPFEQALDGAEDQLHVHGLGATPATPRATHQGREPDDENEDAQHEQHQQNAVGREKRATEQDEAARCHVEKHGRLSVHSKKWQADEQDDQRPPHPEPSSLIATFEQLRPDFAPSSVGVQRWKDAFRSGERSRHHDERRAVMGSPPPPPRVLSPANSCSESNPRRPRLV